MSKKFLSGVFSLFLAAFCLTGLPALDFNIRPRGYALFPAGEGNTTQTGLERYSVGGEKFSGTDIADKRKRTGNEICIGECYGE